MQTQSEQSEVRPSIPNTPQYRKTIRRLVRSVKSLRGLERVPKGYPKTLKSSSADGKDRERFAAQKNSFLDIGAVHYFADSVRMEYSRRDKQPEAIAETPMPQ
jgi:hypothetical protein